MNQLHGTIVRIEFLLSQMKTTTKKVFDKSQIYSHTNDVDANLIAQTAANLAYEYYLQLENNVKQMQELHTILMSYVSHQLMSDDDFDTVNQNVTKHEMIFNEIKSKVFV